MEKVKVKNLGRSDFYGEVLGIPVLILPGKIENVEYTVDIKKKEERKMVSIEKIISEKVIEKVKKLKVQEEKNKGGK